MPVILNLQTTDHELSKRMIDFCSGLTYALDGGMQRIAEKIFLLTPRNVEVSAEEKARLLERASSTSRRRDDGRLPRAPRSWIVRVHATSPAHPRSDRDRLRG